MRDLRDLIKGIKYTPLILFSFEWYFNSRYHSPAEVWWHQTRETGKWINKVSNLAAKTYISFAGTRLTHNSRTEKTCVTTIFETKYFSFLVLIIFSVQDSTIIWRGLRGWTHMLDEVIFPRGISAQLLNYFKNVEFTEKIFLYLACKTSKKSKNIAKFLILLVR